MYDYTTVSDSFLDTTLDSNMSTYTADPCYNLSAILGDTDGLIPQNASRQLLKSLSIVSPGIVLRGEAPNLVVSPITDSVLPQEEFIPDISVSAFQLYGQCISESGLVISKTFAEDYSPLIKLSSDLSVIIRNGISSIYLECFVLYKELVSLTDTNRMQLITIKDLERIDNNIRWVSNIIEDLPSPHFDLLEVLRDLQRTVSYISSITPLFSSTYQYQLDDFTEWTGGVSSV